MDIRLEQPKWILPLPHPITLEPNPALAEHAR